MAEFWDAAARENPLWFINSALDFDHPDEAAFWASGEDALARSLAMFDLQVGPGQRVLEIGCGIGRLTRAIARRGAFVIGLDVSAEMVAQAERVLADVSDRVRLVVGNGRDLAPCADQDVDLVYSFVTFQHIPDPDVTAGYLREMGRVLRPGGRALFQLSDDPRLHRSETWMGQVAAGPRDPTRLHPAWLGSSLPPKRVEAALAEGGLRIVGRRGEGTLFCFTLAQKTA